jgi:hypothetical protein
MNQDFFNIISIGIGIAGIFVGVIIAIFSARHSRKLAQHSGAFRNPKLYLHLFTEALSNKSILPYSLCIVFSGNEQDKAIVPLTFHLANTGDASCEDAVFMIQGPNYCISESNDTLQLKAEPAVYQETFNRSVVNLGEFNQISYLLPQIYPKSAISLTDVFIFKQSINSATKNFQTSDGQIKKLSIHTMLTYPFTVTLLYKDNPGQSSSFNIECVIARSIEEAQNKYLQPFKDEWNEYIANLSFVQKVKYYIIRKRHSRQICFIKYETDKTFTLKKRTVHILKYPEDGILKGNKATIQRIPK